MKELNSIEAAQVAGGGLAVSAIDDVVGAVAPLLSQVTAVALPQAANTVETALNSIFTDLI